MFFFTIIIVKIFDSKEKFNEVNIKLFRKKGIL